MKKLALTALILLLTLTLTACLPGDGSYTAAAPAGFFSGIWHGWLAPLSMLLGFIRGGYRIYEVNNTGLLYDLGFYIAIIGGFGGFSLFRGKKKDK